MDPDSVVVDDISLANAGLVISGDSKTYFNQGAVCTEFTYDRIEKLSVLDFLRSELKRTERARDEVTVVRNAEAASYGLLLGDCALRFHTTGVREAGLSEMVEYISDYSDKKEVRLYNMVQYRLVADVLSGGVRNLVIMVPSTRRIYKSTEHALNDTPYYPPDTWLTVRLTSSMDILGLNLHVLLNDSPDLNAVRLGGWPLSNVYVDGRVCLNNVSFTRALEDLDKLSETARLNYLCEQAVSLFFRSQFNLDLLSEHRYDHGALVSNNPDLLRSDRDNSWVSISKAMLRTMSKPDGWKGLGIVFTGTGSSYVESL